MGGLGSGSGQIGKNTTDYMRGLDIRRLQRGGLLVPGKMFSWQWLWDGEKIASINIFVHEHHLILNYRARRGGEAWEDKKYPVWLDWTACHLGGRRPWFRCPCCGRRVAILYGGMVFACRHCHKLAYASQREDTMSRAVRRMQKIRERLRWSNDRYGSKPKGMHWRTFEHLRQTHACYESISILAMAEKFGIIL